MKRMLCALTALVLLWSMLGGPAAAEYKTLRRGDKGKAVLALKQRMYELGYFTTAKLSNEFNAATKKRLIELQKNNGLTADGVATPEVQALIFSDACLPRSTPDPAPPPTQDAPKEAAPEEAPAPVDAAAQQTLGFLSEGEAPYVRASRKDGVWTYISSRLHIEIRQYAGISPWGANIWLEASVRMKDPRQLVTMLSSGKKPGVTLTTPEHIIETSGLPQPILAFNDDFFGYRVRYIETEKHVGVIVRNGKAFYSDPKNIKNRDDLKSLSRSKFPPLDVLAVFEDGAIKTYRNGEHTAEEYIAMGVRQAFSFGPILVSEGEIPADVSVWGTGHAPRLAMGVTADGVIKVVDVLGRRSDAKGVSVAWLADKMKELGCVEAMNLDGGNTTCLIFMGDMINRPEKTARKDIRRVGGLIAIEENAP